MGMTAAYLDDNLTVSMFVRAGLFSPVVVKASLVMGWPEWLM